MGNEISISPHEIKGKGKSSLDELVPFFQESEEIIFSKFNGNGHNMSAFMRDAIRFYSGVFNASRDILRNNNRPQKFNKLYSAYIASEATKQDLTKDESSLELTIGGLSRADINYTGSDIALLGSISEGIGRITRASSGLGQARKNVSELMETISDDTSSKLQKDYEEISNLYKQANVSGSTFYVKGIKTVVKTTSKTVRNESDNLSKGVQEYNFTPVFKEDIVANKNAIEVIETNTKLGMHYDVKTKRNRYGHLMEQLIIFEGPSGTGKTMLAHYGMTLAREIGRKNNIPYCAGLLNFEDRYQDGGYLNIQKMFNEISLGDMFYTLFLDEMDTKMPSRESIGINSNKNEVIGQFLKFRGGSEYQNLGNYIVLGTTNKSEGIDVAVINRSKLVKVYGPKTPAEKTQVLKNNLKAGSRMGYVNLNDWSAIEKEFSRHKNIFARNIVNISRTSQKNYAKAIANGVPYNASEEEKENIELEIAKQKGVTVTEDEIIYAIRNEAEKERTNYLKDQ